MDTKTIIIIVIFVIAIIAYYLYTQNTPQSPLVNLLPPIQQQQQTPKPQPSPYVPPPPPPPQQQPTSQLINDELVGNWINTSPDKKYVSNFVMRKTGDMYIYVEPDYKSVLFVFRRNGNSITNLTNNDTGIISGNDTITWNSQWVSTKKSQINSEQYNGQTFSGSWNNFAPNGMDKFPFIMQMINDSNGYWLYMTPDFKRVVFVFKFAFSQETRVSNTDTEKSYSVRNTVQLINMSNNDVGNIIDDNTIKWNSGWTSKRS